MSEKTLIWIGLAIGAASLFVGLKTATALLQAKSDADSTLQSVKSSPIGPALAFLGLK